MVRQFYVNRRKPFLYIIDNIKLKCVLGAMAI